MISIEVRGFEHDEIANYMRLLLKGDSTQAERMRILKQQRDRALDETHFARAAAGLPAPPNVKTI